MTTRVPIRQAPAVSTASAPLRDVERQLEELRYVDLRVTANQPLASTNMRLFKVDEPKTDEVQLKAGIPNVVPHGLGRAVKHVAFTLLGDARAWVGALPAGFEPAQVVALFVSADVTARVRVR
jgi:hypothetical protein